MEFIIIGLIVFVILYLLISYNGLIKIRNRVRESLSAIDIYLEQRFDALSKVAEAVVSYAQHERGTFAEITKLRQEIPTLPDDQKVEAYNKLEGLVSGLTVQVENYPELRASENYLHLQKTINELEERLSASRRTYNANATTFNTKIEVIPNNLFAGMMGFSKKPLLVVEERKREDVDLKGILRG